MKQIIKKVFNIPTITDANIPDAELTRLLREPAPAAKKVLDWYYKNIPVNEY